MESAPQLREAEQQHAAVLEEKDSEIPISTRGVQITVPPTDIWEGGWQRRSGGGRRRWHALSSWRHGIRIGSCVKTNNRREIEGATNTYGDGQNCRLPAQVSPKANLFSHNILIEAV